MSATSCASMPALHEIRAAAARRSIRRSSACPTPPRRASSTASNASGTFAPRRRSCRCSAASISFHSCSDSVGAQPLAVQDDRRFGVFFGDLHERQLEALRVVHARSAWLVPISSAPPSIAAPGTRSREADDAAADAVARFEDGDVRAGVRQLVGRRQPGEAGADDDHARAGGALAGEAAARWKSGPRPRPPANGGSSRGGRSGSPKRPCRRA